MMAADTPFQHPDWGVNGAGQPEPEPLDTSVHTEESSVLPYMRASPHHAGALRSLADQLQSRVEEQEQEIAAYRDLLYALARRLWPRQTQARFDESPQTFVDMAAGDWSNFVEDALATVPPRPHAVPAPPSPPAEPAEARAPVQTGTPDRAEEPANEQSPGDGGVGAPEARSRIRRVEPRKRRSVDWDQSERQITLRQDFCDAAGLRSVCSEVGRGHGIKPDQLYQRLMEHGVFETRDSVLGLSEFVIPGAGANPASRRHHMWDRLQLRNPDRTAHNELAYRFRAEAAAHGFEYLTLAEPDAGYTYVQTQGREEEELPESVIFVLARSDQETTLKGLALQRLLAKNHMGVPAFAVVEDAEARDRLEGLLCAGAHRPSCTLVVLRGSGTDPPEHTEVGSPEQDLARNIGQRVSGKWGLDWSDADAEADADAGGAGD